MTLPPTRSDILILVVFFVLNLIVGFRYRGKNHSFREYAIGDKKFSTASLTATLVSNWMFGGALFLAIEQTYARGLFFVMPAIIGGVSGMLFLGYVVGPRMGKFLHNVSLPEALGKLYGEYVQLTAGTSCAVLAIGYIAVQFQVVAKILSILFNYEGPGVVIISAAVVTFYSLLGGIRAVTFANALQFFTFGTLLPILALAIWNNLQDHNQVVTILHTNPLFSLKKVVEWSPGFFGAMMLTGYSFTPGLTPEFFQRMVMARDTAQITRSVGYSALIGLVILLCFTWIAILLLSDRQGMNSDSVVPYMVNMHLYPGLKGFLGIGVMALAMSTADSAINATAVIVANDVLPPLKLQREGSLKTAQYATLLLSILSVLLGLHVKVLSDIILFASCFYTSIVVMPMLLAVFGFQTSRKVVLMAMGAGFITVMVCLTAFKSVNSSFPGMLANLIVMLSAHHLLGEKGGWGHNPLRDKEEERILHLLKPSWKLEIEKERKFRLSTYLKKILPAEDCFYSLFGFYVFTTTYASFYLLPDEVFVQFPKLYKVIQYSVMLLFTTFLAFPIWPSIMKRKHFLSWFLPVCAFYTLFGVGGILVLLGGFSQSQMLIFTLNLVVAALLLHWPVVAAMAVAGITLVFLIFGRHTDLITTPSNLDTLQFRVAFGLLLSSSFLIAVFKYKQAHALLERRNKELSSERKITQQELIKALGRESRLFPEMMTAGNSVLESVNKRMENFSQHARTATTPQQLAEAQHALEDTYRAIKDTMTYLRNVVYRVRGNLQLEGVDYMRIERLLSRAIEILGGQHTQQRPRPRIKNVSGVQFIQCDSVRLQQLLVNAWLYAQQHGNPRDPIFVSIQKTTLGYLIPSVKDHIKEVAALHIATGRSRDFPQAKPLYMGATGPGNFQIPETVGDLILLDNQHIADAHYGSVELIPGDGDNVCTQVYVIPIHLREVRPSMMDLPQMDTGYVVRADKNVRSEETALLKRLKEETPVDMALAEKSIEYIKKYHGLSRQHNGEPFYLHPIAATDIIINYTDDQSVIFATLLHDTVGETPLTLSEIGAVFGPEVAVIVNKAAQLECPFYRINMNVQENVRKFLEETDVRVLQVKLADRLHNMRTIEGHKPEKQKKIAEETLYFFVPVARHLGFKQIEEEMRARISAVMKKC